MNNLLQHFYGQKQNNKAGQHDALTDTKHLKTICLEGAKRLGFQNYLDYLEKNPEQIQRLTKSGNIKRPKRKKVDGGKQRKNVDAADKMVTSDMAENAKIYGLVKITNENQIVNSNRRNSSGLFYR